MGREEADHRRQDQLTNLTDTLKSLQQGQWFSDCFPESSVSLEGLWEARVGSGPPILA